jgi:hypothetical protein
MYLIYDNNHCIESLLIRKDVFLDFVSAPLERDIQCSNIKESENIYDVSKYFIFRSYNYDNIIIIYDILYNKISVFKSHKRIKEYIIYTNILVLIIENGINLIIDIDEKMYINVKLWKNLITNADNIINKIHNIQECKKFNKYISKENIILDNNSYNIDLLIKYKCEKNKFGIHCINFYNNVCINIPDISINKLYLNKIEYNPDYKILDIFNFSLKHVLLITNIDYGNIILLNITTLEQLEFDNYLMLIQKLNIEFYNKINNSFFIE